MKLKEALALKNHTVTIDGVEVTLRRPSFADLAEIMDVAKKEETQKDFVPWLVGNHLLADNGELYFKSLAEVKQCDARFIEKIAEEVDKLYSEGSDLPAQQ